jgi:mono/diheme cytochrome c family protein
MYAFHPDRMGVSLVAAGLFAGASAAAIAQAGTGSTRGELLYSTHCIACHTTQVHWRQRRLVTDWASLKHQVRRWATNTGLGWSDEEIVDVARHLNAAYYRFAITTLTGPAPPITPRSIARAD